MGPCGGGKTGGPRSVWSPLHSSTHMGQGWSPGPWDSLVGWGWVGVLPKCVVPHMAGGADLATAAPGT